MINYEDQNFDLRINEANRMLEKYSTRVPVIVNCGEDLTIVKRKYLVPFDITCGQFLYVLRKYMNIQPEQAVFMFINNILPTSSETIGNIYNSHKNEDLFLYVFITKENTFG